MAQGLSKVRADWDQRAGSIALDLRTLWDRELAFKTALDATTDNDLKTVGPNPYVQGEVDILRSAFGDLDQLRTIWNGSANLLVAKDFRTFAKLLTGVV